MILAGYAAVMVITLLPIAPGGAGLPEILYIGFFTTYAANPAVDDAIGAGVMLFRGMTWFLPIPVGYVALLFQRRGVRRERERAEASGEAPADAAGEVTGEVANAVAPTGAMAAEDTGQGA